MRAQVFVVIMTLLAAAATPAAAEDQDWKDCVEFSVDWDKKISSCTRFLARRNQETQQRRAIAYSNRGEAYALVGDDDRAIADYNEAIRLEPKYADAYFNRGNVYSDKGHKERAISDYDEAIRLNPSYAYAYFFRGKTYFDEGDQDRAISDFSQSIRLKPKTDAYFYRGKAYLEKGDKERAISDYNETIRLASDYPPAYAMRAESWARMGEFERSLADSNAAIRMYANSAYAHAVRAYVLARRGEIDAARDEIAKAHDLDPKDAGVLLYRGEVRLIIGETQAALEDFEASLRLRPGNVYAQKGVEAARSALNQRLQLVSMAPESVLAPASSALSETRVALVIGNARYAAQTPLDNPRKDAAAVADALRQAGFKKVIPVEDLSRKAMVDALQEFQSEADHADWAVIYFSGHGVEIGGENYLVPVDAHLASDRNAPDEAVSLARVMDSVGGAKKLRMVILDACRNNPFNASMRRTLALKSGGKGLSPPKPPAGTLVFYAAKDGEQAQDGKGSNSPFAAALVKNLAERRLELFKMLRYVTVDVQEATRDAQGQPVQHPTFYGDLASREDFYFRPQ